jgi:stage V sporulation protein SpoVS
MVKAKSQPDRIAGEITGRVRGLMPEGAESYAKA